LLQRELFGAKADSASDSGQRDRKMSSSSTGSMKSKWIKAFKSLKSTPGSERGEKEGKGGGGGGSSSSGGAASANASASGATRETEK